MVLAWYAYRCLGHLQGSFRSQATPVAVHLKTMLQQSQATELLGHWQRQLRLEFGSPGRLSFKKHGEKTGVIKTHAIYLDGYYIGVIIP